MTFTPLATERTDLTCPECGEPLHLVTYGICHGPVALKVGQAVSCGLCHFVLQR